MTLTTSGAKFAKNISGSLKNYVRNLLNIKSAVENAKVRKLMFFICPKYLFLQFKIYREVRVMTLKSDTKSEEKQTLLGFIRDMGIW